MLDLIYFATPVFILLILIEFMLSIYVFQTEYFTKKISAKQKMDSIQTIFPNCFIIKQSIPLKEF